ncbi:cytochrome c550 [Mangrovibacillus cuniculi]|uniref:Cytochrome c n=1 Tax=Mangrovibacillus cuniculi TaxID=2593652 RepID=A0A7S8CBH3_9BACI|nr:cytochrome c [Mangrovibacillus cuniculi]QPC46908.1 cytochrome c [Mangrovibacillus cuniculi]
MNRNPLVPFLLIAILGIGTMFFLSIKGLGDAEEIAAEHEGGGEEQASTEEFDPATFYASNCASCHGGNYEGGFGPALAGTELSAEKIKDILQNGQGQMPAGLVPEENLDAMTEWILTLE